MNSRADHGEDGLSTLERQASKDAIGVMLPMIAAMALLMPAHWLHGPWRWIIPALALSISLALWHRRTRRLMYPIRTLTSLLHALSEGDYNVRGSSRSMLSGAIYNVNSLAEALQQERLRLEETSRLLLKTLAALDSAVFVIDGGNHVTLLNPAAQRLYGLPQSELVGRTTAELGLDPLLNLGHTRLMAYSFPACGGRFEVKQAALRSAGLRGRMLVVTDVSGVLRQEERQQWQRLLRTLGHEINNSLAPIRSIADTLAQLSHRPPLSPEAHADLSAGLNVISGRAASLSRFIAGYSKLTQLPMPQRREIDLAQLMRETVLLEPRCRITIEDGSPVMVRADPDQLERALINLLRNALEAVRETGGGVHARCRLEEDCASIEIIDEGPGPPPAEYLMPFFTTKPGGSGIGLALARAIAEAHDGDVELRARDDAPGAIARLWIPR